MSWELLLALLVFGASTWCAGWDAGKRAGLKERVGSGVGAETP